MNNSQTSLIPSFHVMQQVIKINLAPLPFLNMKTLALIFIIINFPLYAIEGDKNTNINSLILKKEIKKIIANSLGKDSDQWRMRDISSAATWLKDGKLVWAADQRLGKSVVCFFKDTGQVTILNTPGEINQSAISLISKYGPYMEWKKNALAFARAIKPLVSDPRSYVGSAAFWNKKQPWLDSWLQDGKMTPESFKKYCEDPQLSEKGDVWCLSFFLYHPSGGIYRINAKGKISPFCVNTITRESVLPADSFYFADEM
jgi:hypothetical protein